MTKKELAKYITEEYTEEFTQKLETIMLKSNTDFLPKESAKQYLEELEKMIKSIKSLCQEELEKEFTYNELKIIKSWFSKKVSRKWDKFVVKFSKEVNFGSKGTKIYKEFSDAVVPILTQALYNKVDILGKEDSNTLFSIIKGFKL